MLSGCMSGTPVHPPAQPRHQAAVTSHSLTLTCVPPSLSCVASCLGSVPVGHLHHQHPSSGCRRPLPGLLPSFLPGTLGTLGLCTLQPGPVPSCCSQPVIPDGDGATLPSVAREAEQGTTGGSIPRAMLDSSFADDDTIGFFMIINSVCFCG